MADTNALLDLWLLIRFEQEFFVGYKAAAKGIGMDSLVQSIQVEDVLSVVIQTNPIETD